MKQPIWNRCQICGRIIAYGAIADGRAAHEIVTPSSEFSDERRDTYHVACATASPQVGTSAGETREGEASDTRLSAATQNTSEK